MKDLRDFLTEIDRRGDLVRIKEHIEDGHEIFTILWELSSREKSPVVVFESVKDFELPIVANVFGTMNRFAKAARFPEDQSYKFYRDLFIQKLTEKNRWLEPVEVKNGPVKDIILKGREVNLYDLPIMQWHPNDGGPYITWPIQVTHDEKYGTNLGTYRMMIHERNKTGLMCSLFQDIGAHLKKAKKMGMSSLPCSVVIGADPALYLASSCICGSHFMSVDPCITTDKHGRVLPGQMPFVGTHTGPSICFSTVSLSSIRKLWGILTWNCGFFDLESFADGQTQVINDTPRNGKILNRKKRRGRKRSTKPSLCRGFSYQINGNEYPLAS